MEYVRRMLFAAAYWRFEGVHGPLDEALRPQDLHVCLDGWGRKGDRG